jgi:hypothetical protein
MEAIWGQRRFFVPGVVFLAVLAMPLALSGTFAEFQVEEGQAGLAAIAVVIAGGIAGYPLGLILYIPFAFFFRWPIGGYGRFLDFRKFCAHFLTATESAPASLETFRTRCQEGLDDPNRAERFYASFYDRFVPDRVDRSARGRWETMHTIGGMIFAIIFGLGLSPLVVAVTPHKTPWWDDVGILASVVSIGAVVVVLLTTHAILIARDAADMERQWAVWWLDLVRRRPQILQATALGDEFNRWTLSTEEELVDGKVTGCGHEASP